MNIQKHSSPGDIRVAVEGNADGAASVEAWGLEGVVSVWPWAEPGEPSPSCWQHLLVPGQALKEVMVLGCRKAMKRFERLTLLVSGGFDFTVRNEGKEGAHGAFPKK